MSIYTFLSLSIFFIYLLLLHFFPQWKVLREMHFELGIQGTELQSQYVHP
jgi:hypothetical protein